MYQLRNKKIFTFFWPLDLESSITTDNFNTILAVDFLDSVYIIMLYISYIFTTTHVLLKFHCSKIKSIDIRQYLFVCQTLNSQQQLTFQDRRGTVSRLCWHDNLPLTKKYKVLFWIHNSTDISYIGLRNACFIYHFLDTAKQIYIQLNIFGLSFVS